MLLGRTLHLPRQRLLRVSLSSLHVQAMLFILAPILLLVATTLFAFNTDPDYWWHVRTGQYIYDTGTLPRLDIYSYTSSGQPWVTHEWLTELVFYVLTRLGGYRLVAAIFALLGVLTCSVLYLTCRRRGLGEIGASLCMLWGFVMASASLNVRPQAITTLFLALCTLVITCYLQGQTGPLYLLPPLFALWVNLHGGYVIGLVLIALTVVGQIVDTWQKRALQPLRPLLSAAILSVGATLLNPHGLTALTYPFSYVSADNASMLYIVEWQSPNFHEPFFLVFAASLLLVMLLGLARRPLAATDTLVAMVFTFLALRSGRHISLYAVVMMPLIAARLQAELPAFGRTLQQWHSKRLLAVIWPLTMIAILVVIFKSGGMAHLQVGLEPGERGYPSGAVRYLRDNNLKGNLFNEYGWGGYLIYRLYPDWRVFIDGRADVYGDEFMNKYMDVAWLHPRWRNVLDEYKVNLVLVKAASPLAVVLSNDRDWQEIYSGEVEQLFKRKAE